MFKDVICEFSIKTRNYDDFRDWFFLKEDRPKVYKTKLLIYLNEKIIGKKDIPINFSKVNVEVSAVIDNKCSLDNYSYQIPEMKVLEVNPPMFLLPDNNINVNLNLNME